MKKNLTFYLTELKSLKCFCGRNKARGKSFCGKCFSSLPRKMKKDLYQHIFDGYPEAYDSATEWLE